MVHPWILFFGTDKQIAAEVEDLANFIDIPLFSRNIDTTAVVAMVAHRLLKIEDTDIVTHLGDRNVTASQTLSLHDRDDNSTNYTFPNKTVKFFVVIDVGSLSTGIIKIRTSTTADTADGTIRETIAVLSANNMYSTDIIEGNFNGKFLTIENPAGGSVAIRSAVIVEPA